MEINEAESDYPTCERCYATLFVETGENSPDIVTEHLKLEPTHMQVRGGRMNEISHRISNMNAWALSTKGRVVSKDLRKHLDWLFDKLDNEKKEEIAALREVTCRFSVWCYWLSKAGHGGPTISLPQIRRLADFGFELLMDVYFLGDEVHEP